MTPTHVTVCDTCTDTSCAGEAGIGAGHQLAERVTALHEAGRTPPCKCTARVA